MEAKENLNPPSSESPEPRVSANRHLGGMMRRRARTVVPSKRVKADWRRTSRELSLRAFADWAAKAGSKHASEWRKNKK